MAWTYNGVRIFPQTKDGTTAQTIARLQPLTGPTILQFFGYESEVIKMSAYVIGDTDKNYLIGFSQSSGYALPLVYNTTTIGNYYLHSFSYSQKISISQTLRTDLDCTASVYIVEMELYPQ